MQQKDGSMEMLTEEQATPIMIEHPKVLSQSKYFKIKQCYFKISKITESGIEVVGVSRREFYENR